MNRHVRGLGLVVAVALGALASCTTTSFKSTWRDPTAQPITLRGQKVAVFMMSQNESTRRAGEDILAREVSAHGVQAIPGYQLTGGQPPRDSEALRRQLEQAGVEGTVIMRVVDRRQEVNYVPGGPYYGTMYGYWDYGWGMVGSPGYLQTDTIVSVETLVYSVKQDKLLWGGVSETTDPQHLDGMIAEIVKAAGKEMRKAGLVQG
ncbi:MAG TPA: hypothetical protein VIF57_02780 [Polyangia bacterium]